jgi:FkbM family methyltransferase
MYLDIKYNRLSKIRVPGIKETIFLRKDTSDVAIFEQIFLRGDYDLDFKFHPQTVVDAGAHIGLFSILMKNRFPGAKIICIEPDKNNYEALNKNISGYDNVETVRAGLWNSDTQLEIVDRYHAGHSALTVEENVETGSVPGVTISNVMESYGLKTIDVLKIDIETSEMELFLRNYEDWLPKVRMIIIELHDWLKPGCSKIFFEAINRSFEDYSYSVCGENTIIEKKDINGY